MTKAVEKSFAGNTETNCLFCDNILLPSTKVEVNAFAHVHLSVCLPVCLLARLLKNACMDLDEMLRVDRCWDMDELITI